MKNYIEVEAPEFICCYCKRRVQEPLRVAIQTDEREAREVAKTMIEMMKDGISLECGECRE